MKKFDEPRVAPRLGTMWTLWLNLLASLGVYALVGVLVTPTGGPGAEVRATLTAVLAIASLAEVTAVVALRSVLEGRMSAMAFAIVRWAIADSVAIFGLVLRFLGASVSTMAIFAAAGALLLVVWRPGGESR